MGSWAILRRLIVGCVGIDWLVRVGLRSMGGREGGVGEGLRGVSPEAGGEVGMGDDF